MANGASTLDHTFRLSLQVRQPSLDMSVWTKAVRRARGGRRGGWEKRVTGAGAPLEGVYKNSYAFWELSTGRGDVLARGLVAATQRPRSTDR
jgi:hypothetical protein